jgi:divalent anion:Na+ symporter, DASS family
MQKNLIKWLIVLAVGFGIAFAPVPDGITKESWRLLAIFIATVVGSIVQPLTGSAMVFLGVIAVVIFGALPIDKALKGYSDPVVWLVLAAFFLSRGMIKTGLGRRTALYFVRAIGAKTLGLGYSLVIAETLLATVVPSTGARMGGIILPITRSIAETYDSHPNDESANKLGTFLINLLYQTEVIICATFLTGQVSNFIIADFAMKNANIELTYANWLIASSVPSILSLIVIPLMIYKFFPPEIRSTPKAAEFAKEQLAKLGKVSWQEWVMLAVFLLVVVLWATKKLNGLDTTLVAFLGIAVLLLTKVLDWKDITNEHSAWEVFIWYGGLVNLATSLGETGLTKLFAEKMASYTNGMNWTLALAILVFIYFYSHYAFASITAHVTAMYVPFLVVTIAVGSPPALAVLLLAFFSNLNAGITHYGTTSGPILFGVGYVKQTNWWTIGLICSIINIAIWTIIGLIWWKFLGWY